MKKGDFVEVEYTGKTKEGILFDTTDENLAKKEGLNNPNMEYGPVVICIGEGNILKGLDTKLTSCEMKKAYTFDIAPEDGFGKKKAEYIQLIATAKFKKAGIQPQPGLQVNVDDMVGVIKTVTGGRTIVDFNHPLSGKDLVYDITVNKEVTDKEKQIESILKFGFHIPKSEIKVDDKKATVTFEFELPKEIQDEIGKKIKELTDVVVTFKKSEKKATK